jgi:hypothetical protein
MGAVVDGDKPLVVRNEHVIKIGVRRTECVESGFRRYLLPPSSGGQICS